MDTLAKAVSTPESRMEEMVTVDDCGVDLDCHALRMEQRLKRMLSARNNSLRAGISWPSAKRRVLDSAGEKREGGRGAL